MSSILDLPAEVNLQTLSDLTTFPDLCSLLTAVPSFQHFLSRYPETNLSNILTHELALADRHHAGHSITIHALLAYQASEIFDNGKAKELRNRKVHFYKQVKQSMGLGFTPEKELNFWLEVICKKEEGRLVLPIEAVKELCKDAESMGVYFEAFISFTLRKMKRDGTVKFVADKTVCALAVEASKRPISEGERQRIYLAIYGLHVAQELGSVCPDSSDYGLTELVYKRYDTLWQHEGIRAFYLFLVDRFRPLKGAFQVHSPRGTLQPF